MLRVFGLTALLAFTSSVSQAQDMPELDEIVQVRLISGWQMPSGSYMGALQVTLAPGWKTYWRVGGETGIPPRFNWQASTNLSDVEIHWPRPEILSVSGVAVIGYKNELVLPLEFKPETNGQGIFARAELEMGVCSDICIPVQMPLSVNLDENEGENRFLIELALGDGAILASDAGFSPAQCSVSTVEDGYKVTSQIKLHPDTSPPDAVVFEASNQDVWVTQSVSVLEDEILLSEALFLNYSGKEFSLSDESIRITLISENQAVDFQGCAIR